MFFAYEHLIVANVISFFTITTFFGENINRCFVVYF